MGDILNVCNTINIDTIMPVHAVHTVYDKFDMSQRQWSKLALVSLSGQKIKMKNKKNPADFPSD